MRRNVFDVREEIYADGTATQVKYQLEIPLMKNLPVEWEAKLRNPKTGKRIKANPSAAEVWLMERQNGAPWRERAERLQQIEDEKAKQEFAQKSLSLLAKQVSDGLKRVYNANFESSDLIPLLSEASKEGQKPKPDPNKTALLKAAQRFDLKSVSHLLSCYDKSKPGRPSLSILSSCPVRPKP